MAELIYRTLRENIADIIRKRIIYQELEPGQKIVEQDLAKEFKTSRAPIREALRQLENEGLIEYVRNAGCSVKEITLEESFEIYLMRANYETMAVKLMGGNVPEDTICRMEEVLEKMKKLDEEHVEKRVAFEVSVSKLELLEDLLRDRHLAEYSESREREDQNVPLQ